MRASAALVFAICSSDSSASCMRAPPLAEKQTSGLRCSRQCSTARTKRSPTDRAHRAAEERELERAGDDRQAVQRARHDDQRILLLRGLLRLLQAVAILLACRET